MGTRFIRKLDFEVESRGDLSLSLSLLAFTICILHSRWHVGPGEAAIMSRAYAYSQVTPSPGRREVWIIGRLGEFLSTLFSRLSPTLPLSVAAHNARASRGAPATSYYNVKL